MSARLGQRECLPCVTTFRFRFATPRHKSDVDSKKSSVFHSYVKLGHTQNNTKLYPIFGAMYLLA
jgi:hypothetical protein